jgi:hypothetical protein
MLACGIEDRVVGFVSRVSRKDILVLSASKFRCKIQTRTVIGRFARDSP